MDEDEADKTHADGARAELAKLLAVLGMLEAARARDLELYAEDAQDDPFWQLLRMVLLIRIYADYIGSDRVDAAGIKRWLRGHSVRAYIPGSELQELTRPGAWTDPLKWCSRRNWWCRTPGRNTSASSGGQERRPVPGRPGWCRRGSDGRLPYT